MFKNGDKTYSKTPFKESKHKRESGGTFAKKAKTEESDVSYHHKFSGESHPRKSDGSFKNNYTSDSPGDCAGEGVKTGKAKYGK